MGSFRLPSPLFTKGLCAVAVVLAVAPASRAQDAQTPAPAHIAIVDGAATVERDGQAQSAIPGLPIVPGDRLRTTRGRAEVLFPDGSALDVDEFTSVDIQSQTLLRLSAGRVMLIVAGANDPSNAVAYQIDTPAASAFTEGPGEYRVALFSSAGGVETELAVFRGSASLSTEQGSTRARAGERTLARDLSAPSYAVPFNSARFDAFDHWSMSRRDARLGTASAQYLPPSLSMYSGTFDRYGQWLYEPAYGYVWYPAVAPTWRPYYLGYWAPIHSYGWTWIGFDIWGWPTYHYGRWGYISNRWFWIPGHQWAPAWVWWAAAPGYVGWCPLGFNNAPLFALWTDGWPGWTFVPRQHFGGVLHVVHHYAVSTTSIPPTTAVIQQPHPPVAIPRPRPVAPDATTQSARRAIPRPTPETAPLQPSGIPTRQPVTVGSRQPLADNAPAARFNRQSSVEPHRTPIPTEGTPAYVIRGTAPSSATRELPAPSRTPQPPFDAAQGRPTYSMPPRTPAPPAYSLPQRTAPAPPQAPFDAAQGRPSYSLPPRTPAPPAYSLPPRIAPPPPQAPFDPAQGRPSSSLPPRTAPPPAYSMPPRMAPPPATMPSRSEAPPAPPSSAMPSRSAPAPAPAAPAQGAPPSRGPQSR